VVWFGCCVADKGERDSETETAKKIKRMSENVRECQGMGWDRIGWGEELI
jgi:hypothetical protein